ncbi:MAG: cytochrome c family protein [Alphaproteobacteria bacterium]|nr:MAG: cytochrome c family protein [Alphaproteobacteria bacterium]
MSSLENNKIFAAVLCVGITIMLTNFVADKIIVSEPLEKDAVAIDGAVASGHGASTPKKPKIPDPIMALLATADMAKGAKISKACAACHSFDKGGPVKQGPNLWNITGSNKGGKISFSYSKGMQEAGGIWDYDSLNKFLTKPKKFISGTKMNFAGLKKAKDRAAFVAWLRMQADTPFALPNDADIAAEQIAFAPPVEEEPHHDNTETQAEEAAPKESHH